MYADIVAKRIMEADELESSEALSDGSVRVCLGELCGTVSSWHLVEPKLAQLRCLAKLRRLAAMPKQNA